MRRVTWQEPKVKVCFRATIYSYIRESRQRTRYYMPWGEIEVDELSKMEYDRSPTILACFDERDDSWFEETANG